MWGGGGVRGGTVTHTIQLANGRLKETNKQKSILSKTALPT